MTPHESRFTALEGHQSSLESLRRGGRKEPFPSLIFSGPGRIGKRLAGIWYAAYLNCFAADGEAPCGQCGSCKKVLSGHHPDLLLTRVPEKKTVVGVGEVREAIHQIQYAPFEGNYRVWVVEESERLTDEAQNALLKTLEEPPRAAVIVLVTHLFGALIPTVVSRCRLVRFQALSVDSVKRHLIEKGAEPEKASTLAQLSGGAVGAALDLHRNPQSLESWGEALHLFLSLPGQNLWGAVETAQKLEKLKLEGVRQLLDIGTSAYRDLLLTAVGSGELVANAHFAAELRQLGEKVQIPRVRTALEAFQDARQHLNSHVSNRLLLQNLCLSLSKLTQAR